MMIDELQIPIEYKEKTSEKIEGLLLTIDCQYGARNVTVFEADAVAIIDHHQQEIMDVEDCLIKSTYGSCSTLVWELLLEEGMVHAEAFVSLTNFDEENIMLSLFAKSMSKAKLITHVHRIAYDEIINELDFFFFIFPVFFPS